MTDLTFTRSGELEVTHVEGDTPEGIVFVDGLLPFLVTTEVVVVDSGRVIVPTRDAPALERVASRKGLTVGHKEGL